MQLGFRPLAFIALGIVSCVLTMTGTALNVAEFEIAYQTYRVITGIIDVEGSGSISLWEVCARASARPSFCGGVTGDTCPASTQESCTNDFEGCAEGLIQAGRAFAIMSCIVGFFGLVGGGVADLAGVLPVARFVLAGVATCVFVLDLIAFCMFYGVWTTTCSGQSIADTPGWKWGPMPILFLVAMALSFVLVVVALVSAVLEALAAEEAAAEAEAGGDARELPATEPSGGPGVEGDWVWAGEWGLWWSATEALYLDPVTSRQYDPTSGLWRELGTGEWADDVVKRSLPSGPPSVPPCTPTAVTDGDGRAGDYADVDTATPV